MFSFSKVIVLSIEEICKINGKILKLVYSVEREMVIRGMLTKLKLNIKPPLVLGVTVSRRKVSHLFLCVICEYFFSLFFPFFLDKIIDFLRT